MSFAARNVPAAEAGKWLKRVADLIPADAIGERVSLAEAWGELRTRSGDATYAKEARAILDPLAEKSDAKPETLMALATRLDQDGDFAEAEKVYRRIVALGGQSIIAQNNLAMLLARNNGDLHEAQRFVDDAIAQAPVLPALYDTKAFVLSRAGDMTGAVTSMERAVELQPSNLDYHVHLAELLLQCGQRDRVRTALAELEKMPTALRSMSPDAKQRLESVRGLMGDRPAGVGLEAKGS